MQRVDEQARVSDLPASATTHEAPKLLLSAPSLPCRLPLEGAERSKLTLGVEDLFHGGGTERADQLILQVCPNGQSHLLGRGAPDAPQRGVRLTALVREAGSTQYRARWLASQQPIQNLAHPYVRHPSGTGSRLPGHLSAVHAGGPRSEGGPPLL